MEKIFDCTSVKSRIRAISSKSEAHRALICAALADKKTKIICTDTNSDIDTTALCLNSLGAVIERVEDGFSVSPIGEVTRGASLDCNESGSTLRFMLPLCASLGADCSFIMRGRLASRPLSPLYELLAENGITLSNQGTSPLCISGRLAAGNYSVAANISSQYISGMLFALSVAEGESTLSLTGKIESAPYIWMTLDTLVSFGADIRFDSDSNSFYIKGKKKLVSPDSFVVGGDWSNAAFFLVAGAIGSHPVTLTGLDKNSRQGDRAILEVLRDMGACIIEDKDEITVSPSTLRSTRIDAANIPDLVPILATAASVAEGETVIYNASRLRLKESDRIESVCKTLSSLGAFIRATEDGMMIRGKKRLLGGRVVSFNDHRIAMSAAVASLVCDSKVVIDRFEAINKSYPSFLDGWEE
ncbi:MAG: 3-phosphoshikimate 1-carboxyvinyltransferase [Clostridia bacterium]|nr:3-phosphoshikimate 1-carboxyvinyltransferase [Clostridia bacterium]